MAQLIFILSIILANYFTIVSKYLLNESDSTNPCTQKYQTLAETKNSIYLFSDNFEKGVLTGWIHSDDWEVSDTNQISGHYSLKHLNQTKSGSASIFHPISADWNSFDLEWSFSIKNGKWDPSSSNKFWFYLSADTIKPELINGFAVGINISGSNDLLSLWRIRNGKADSLIVQSDLDWNASTLANISVKRTTNSIWILTYLKSGDLNPKSFSGSDPGIFAFKTFGFYFKYTTTRSGQLWIDDIVVNQSTPELSVKKLSLISSHLLKVNFNSPINPSSVLPGNFKMTDEFNREIEIDQVVLSNNSNQTIEIRFGKVEGTELSLSISGVSDLTGNIMKTETHTISYSFPPDVGSVLINEILFNPFTGGSDFVELVNVSEYSIPIHRLKLATRNDTLALKQTYPISTEIRFLKPGQFLCCSKSPDIIATQYPDCNTSSFVVMNDFPSYPDDAGTVVLLNDSMDVLDEFSYSEKMHSPFLANDEGVSLERISTDQPTNDRKNWASAASSVGWASPGLPNSQTLSANEIQDEIVTEPQAFSPNGDGYNDELTIRFKLNKPGFVANVRLFDAAGRQVKYLVKNQSIAQEGNWIWDGKNESGQKMNMGVYIILVEVFNQQGHRKEFKQACTITDRLE